MSILIRSRRRRRRQREQHPKPRNLRQFADAVRTNIEKAKRSSFVCGSCGVSSWPVAGSKLFPDGEKRSVLRPLCRKCVDA